MEAVVIALPAQFTPARLGERFTLREDSPLLVGPGREARLRLGPQGAGELVIGTRADAPFVKVTGPALRASLCGQPLHGSMQVPVQEGDSLYVHPGLVLQFRDRAPAAPARHGALEARLSERDDDSTWAVYADYLEEGGDPLATWLALAPSAGTGARRRQLLGLAESERTHLAHVTWSERGMLSALTLTRQAVLSAPGLDWHLDQLARLPVARLLPRLAVALFAGPNHNDGALVDADALAAHTLDGIARLESAPALRSVSLGFVSHAQPWPLAQAAWQRLQARAPHLQGALCGALLTGARARLSLLSRMVEVEPVMSEVVLNPMRTDVGTAPGCLVRLMGVAPQVACTVYRSNDGQWVVFDESADPFRPAQGPFALRVNGAVASRAALAPGDVLEPVEGLRFLFDVS